MMIRDLAAFAGVTTRTVRHYHAIGVLPEPERDTNGYRRYSLREVVLLLRIRKLREFGLSLDEISDVLAEENGQDLREILQSLDEDLARQEQSIQDTRSRIAHALSQSALETAADFLAPTARAFFGDLSQAGISGPTVSLDAELMASLPEAESAKWVPAWQAMMTEPAVLEEVKDIYAQLDVLHQGQPEESHLSDLADRLVVLIPEELLPEIASFDLKADASATAFIESLPPAHARLVELVHERVASQAGRQS